jgi:hypothetical protein
MLFSIFHQHFVPILKTSFLPNFSNKTTSVAINYENISNLITSFSPSTVFIAINEVMRLHYIHQSIATEVVLLEKLGKNEVAGKLIFSFFRQTFLPL